MPTVRRSRVIQADPAALWAILDDPHHLPRWWPKASRVESVARDHFTLVLATERGRSVRADYAVAVREPPRRRVWRQEVEGTPFERILRAAEIEALVEPGHAGAAVTLELRQHPRGFARLGGFMLRRAARHQLDNALASLEAICG
ncbi:MAG: SRPBCC family protein [Solirubrobacteraceae bacterium]